MTRLVVSTGLTAGVAATTLLGATLVMTTGTPSLGAEPAGASFGLVVKVSDATGCTVDRLADEYGFSVDGHVLATRGIYRGLPSDPGHRELADVKKIVDKLDHDDCVGYAEPDFKIALSDEQFHSWTPNSPAPASQGDWVQQPARDTLRLGLAHETATGLGITVAVLDTGVDQQQEALAGRLTPGHDYVDDDADPYDGATGTDSDGDGVSDAAVGHGTFVTGMVVMVAPDARIMPMRVLDSDGQGTVFAVAEALYDAVAAGADVVNMSFGTSDKVESKVVSKALKDAAKRGVLVVAAAGNDSDDKPRFPASVDGVTAVAATNPGNSALASYSNRGPWVDVAAVGNELVGPLPGNQYGTWSGTSLSAPLVAGQLALLRSADPDREGKKIAEALDKTCHKVSHAKVRDGVVDPVASLVYLLAH